MMNNSKCSFAHFLLKIETFTDPCLGRIPLPNQMNFWKSARGGGGVIFNPKI